MKKLLLLLLFAILAIAWLSIPIKKPVAMIRADSAPQINSLPKSNFILPDPVPDEKKPPVCMSLAEYAKQAKTNPNAYYLLMHCDDQAEDRTELDKLLNYLSRLKYE